MSQFWVLKLFVPNNEGERKRIKKKKTVMKVESENYRKVKSESQKKRTMSQDRGKTTPPRCMPALQG